ncbi:putative hydroxylase [Mycolicibacterium farcinogenes]|uniref:Putative hydroxylase n=2 Tax=Mycobacteriaceae TaxID=1762 RepID=A0A378T306_9MYCO|nr:putative hydroxylase [Mycolicibacterium farcinogenes]STZ55040.1 putative hydroxylase [Mycolicibacterium senegalense]
MRGVEMTRDVLDGIDENAARIQALGLVNETLGRLDSRTVDALRESGVMHMLQPAEFGGIETHPGDFAEAVLEISRLDGAAGWVAGSVGVPPWALASADRRLRDEVWEADSDVWIASAHPPAGVLLPVDGGYRLSGEWPSVAAIDHCDWVVVGARVVGTGEADGLGYSLVPRADLHIVEGSGAAIGLIGTGSKSITIDDVFIPGHRLLNHNSIVDGTAAAHAGLRNPIYHIPLSTIAPLGIAAAVIGMAEGALAHRIDAAGAEGPVEEHAAAEIRASRLALLDTLTASFNRVLDGPIDPGMRARARRDQIAAARRAVRAVDEIVCRSSVDALHRTNPVQRFWRDAHVGFAMVVGESKTVAP